MELQFLLLSADPSLVREFQLLAGEVRLALTVAAQAHAARQQLASRQFDAVVVDCDDTQGAVALLKEIRRSTANRSAAVLAIVDGVTASADALDMGANATLSKPLRPGTLRAAVLDAARTLQRRNHDRVAVSAAVYVSFGGVIDRLASAINVSEGGMALRCDDRIDEHEPVRVKFALPGLRAPVQARGEVAWANAGNYGVRFTAISQPALEEFREWLRRVQTERAVSSKKS